MIPDFPNNISHGCLWLPRLNMILKGYNKEFTIHACLLLLTTFYELDPGIGCHLSEFWFTVMHSAFKKTRPSRNISKLKIMTVVMKDWILVTAWSWEVERVLSETLMLEQKLNIGIFLSYLHYILSLSWRIRLPSAL